MPKQYVDYNNAEDLMEGVANRIDTKQPRVLDTPIVISGVEYTTVESAIDALNDISGEDTTKQPKVLETPIYIDGGYVTTVEGALAALNGLADDILVDKQPVVLDTPVTIGGTSQTTVEGAIGALNTAKQDKTLSSAITVDGVSQTTVEGALGALNTLAGNNKADKQNKTLDVPVVVNGTTTTTVEAAIGAINNSVVFSDDARLTNARHADDVYAWAKEATKPSYTATEVGAVPTSAVGAASGVAELGEDGKVIASQLPSFVDDVEEYNDISDFPATGESGKIYIDKSTNITYRWGGSTYVPIGSDLALGETSSTAYRGDRGKAAYDHAIAKGTQHSLGLYKIETNSEGHVVNATPVLESDLESMGFTQSGVIPVNPSISGDAEWVEHEWPGFNLDGQFIWTDGDDMYYSDRSSQYVLNKNSGEWENKTWPGSYYPIYGYYVWSDGENIYYSEEANQYVLNKSTGTWDIKMWALPSQFSGNHLNGDCIWTDGENIYYSNDAYQFVLDKLESTWELKTWNGFTSLYGCYIWTDGDDIYYSNSMFGSHDEYVLNKSTDTWITKTWNGITDIYGNKIWSDGDNIYCSIAEGPFIYQYVLDKSTDTWSAKTWDGLSTFDRIHIWTDGENIYHSLPNQEYILQKASTGATPNIWIET